MTMGLLEPFFMRIRNSEEMVLKREISTGRSVLMSAEPLQGEKLLIKTFFFFFTFNKQTKQGETHLNVKLHSKILDSLNFNMN